MKRILSTLFFALAVAAASAAPQTVRLLTVGNSFADNSLTYLPQIVEAAGHELIVGKANLGGCTFERHWGHVAKHEADPDDPEGSPYQGGKKSLDDLLRQDQWDFITVQQVSYKSHDLKTYQPFADNLLAYIRERAPRAKILAHQIWAYRVDDPRFKPENEGKEPHNRKVMYEQVRAAYHALAKEQKLGIIPSGDAMYLADSDYKWGFRPDHGFDPSAQPQTLPDQAHSLHAGWHWRKGKDGSRQLRMDGHHASAAGKYLLGCVWFEALFGESVEANAFAPDGFDPDYARFLRATAHRAFAALDGSFKRVGAASLSARGPLPRIVLIGDSIRLGYAPLVTEALKGRAVIVSSKSNGGDSSNVLKRLDLWAIQEKPDIVHFNCGIHDTKRFKAAGNFQVPPAQYEANLREIVKRLRSGTKAAVFFATTTPILDDRAAAKRADRDYELTGAAIRQYNEIALRVMLELDVPVDDLNTALAKPEPPLETGALIGDDGVHPTPEGKELLAKRVAAFLSEKIAGKDAR